MRRIDPAVVLVTAGVAILGGLLVYAFYKDAQAWHKFRIEQNCKVVGKISPSTGVGPGVGANGQMTTVVITTPGKTGWLCDDGVTYWR